MLHGRQGVRMADLRDQGGRNDQRERAAVPPDGLDLDNQRPHFRRRAELTVSTKRTSSESLYNSAFLGLPLCLHVGKRGVSALLQGQFDALQEQIMDFAPLVEGDLP